MTAKRNKQAYRERDQHAWPAWAWLGLGVLLGLALSAIVLVKDWAPMLRRQDLPQPNAQATAPKQADQGVADDAGAQPARPRKTYDFYSVLPEMEVVIPDAELSAKAKAERQRQEAEKNSANQAAPPPSTSGGSYVLLAGSYGDPRAADEAKAKLALLGIVAKVQKITINGKVWNRVMVGPYSNASQTEATKQILASNGVKAIPMKQSQ